MSEERFKDLIEKRTNAGLYYRDTDYPNDEEEREFEKCGSNLSRFWKTCLTPFFETPRYFDTHHFNLQITTEFHPSLQENWIYMPEGRVIRQDDTNTERLKVAASKKLDSDLLNTFISEEGGPLQAGALPHVLAASEKGQQAVLQALEEGSQVQKPKKKKEKKDEGEEVEPKTVHQWGPQNQGYDYTAWSIFFLYDNS